MQSNADHMKQERTMRFRKEKESFVQDAVLFNQVLIDRQEQLRRTGKTEKIKRVLSENPHARVIVSTEAQKRTIYEDFTSQVVVYNNDAPSPRGYDSSLVWYVDELDVQSYLELTQGYGITIQAGFLRR